MSSGIGIDIVDVEMRHTKLIVTVVIGVVIIVIRDISTATFDINTNKNGERIMSYAERIEYLENLKKKYWKKAYESYEAFQNSGDTQHNDENLEYETISDAIEYLQQLTKRTKEMNKMKIGDRIVVTQDFLEVKKGMTGKIVEVVETDAPEPMCAVEIDSPFLAGHTCMGLVPSGRGYYLGVSSMKLLDDDKNWKIIIIPNGDMTIAKFIRNRKCIKETFVNRYFKDTYNIETAAKEAISKLFKPAGYTGRAIYYNTSKAEGLTRGKIYTFENGVYKNDNGEYQVICRENIGRYDEYFEKLFIKIVE